jgi:phenylalanyl-tRNA synthetase alpha chain
MKTGDLSHQISAITTKLQLEILNCKKSHDFLLLRSKFLGNNSEIKILLKEIKNFDEENKRIFGKKIQESLEEIERIILEAENNFCHEKKFIDTTLSLRKIKGFPNLIAHTIKEIKEIFLQMNYQFSDSPEITTEFLNFDALNVHKKHPSRDVDQSFFLENNKMLRTHTSSIQNHLLKKNLQDFQAFTVGRVFRRDSDNTHVPMFHQIEGICVGKNANVRSMFQSLKTLLSNFFNIENPVIRIRPSFFPFTEPSYEIDMKLGEKWLEILGCGIIHPNVFKFADRKPELGFAFGCGIERFAMIKHNIKDLREVYSNNAFVIQKIGGRL